jgi:magnesium-transporting ATPase (P-type)
MADEYWKRPEPQQGQQLQQDPSVGIWSRSSLFRAVVWIVVICAIFILALVVSAYLSGFTSVSEMVNWMRQNINL